eukprot:Clim_evm23s233 gene=Clim_evmTU23s233
MALQLNYDSEQHIRSADVPKLQPYEINTVADNLGSEYTVAITGQALSISHQGNSNTNSDSKNPCGVANGPVVNFSLTDTANGDHIAEVTLALEAEWIGGAQRCSVTVTNIDFTDIDQVAKDNVETGDDEDGTVVVVTGHEDDPLATVVSVLPASDVRAAILPPPASAWGPRFSGSGRKKTRGAIDMVKLIDFAAVPEEGEKTENIAQIKRRDSDLVIDNGSGMMKAGFSGAKRRDSDLVIDNGSGMVKAGYGGVKRRSDVPRRFPVQDGTMAKEEGNDIGVEATKRRSNCPPEDGAEYEFREGNVQCN